MSRRKPPDPDATLPVIHPHAAAVDVHSDNHVACVGPGRVRTFGACSADLHALADWFRAEGVTSVVLESTGVYWIPLFELLESRGFEVFLIEPSQASHCGARPKTDRLDCQWLRRLHSCGLLRPSFRPPAAVLALRGYWRQRQRGRKGDGGRKGDAGAEKGTAGAEKGTERISSAWMRRGKMQKAEFIRSVPFLTPSPF